MIKSNEYKLIEDKWFNSKNLIEKDFNILSIFYVE